MNLLYRLTVDTVYDSVGNGFVAYGIEVVCDGNHAKAVKSVPAVSIDKEAVESVVSLCNRVELSPVHLEDVIMDEIIQNGYPFDRYKKAARQKRTAFPFTLIIVPEFKCFEV